MYNDKPGEHVLIGNVCCNGHQLDAIYIERGQISVIDFKDYRGELTFSENNPWKMINPEGELVFVQGGAQMRNPFQQVKAYRFSLMDYLKNHEVNILEVNRANFRWDHIGCIVLFQNKVIFNLDEIPQKTKRFFHISDPENINNLLDSINSQSLNFTDNEINSILLALDVKPENLTDNYSFDDTDPAIKKLENKNIALIKRLVSKSIVKDIYSKLIDYYNILIQVESYKEADVSKTLPISRDHDVELDDYFLDLNLSVEFHQEYLKNLQEKFPKNLFVALNISIDGVIHPLFNTIILHTDIPNDCIVNLNFNNFEIHNKAFERIGLSEDIIDELTNATNIVSTFEEKLECIRDILGVELSLSNNFLIGLSNESLFNAQLKSELTTLSKFSEEGIENAIFKSFIFNSGIENKDLEDNPDKRIQVTPLNSSQLRAINLSFKQPLTVITGPPGTGKSQVVLNLISNAISSGQSIMFASKSNKAIDCVKERMDEILKEPYLLRMGSRDEINSKLKPQLSNFISRKNNSNFIDNSDELTLLLKNISENNTRLDHFNSQLLKIQILEKQIKQSNLSYNEKLDFLLKELEDFGKDYTNLFFDNVNSVKIEINEVNLLIGKIDNWQSGKISKLLFKWFQKSKFENMIKSINKDQSTDLYEFVQIEAPWTDPEKELLVSAKDNLKFLKDLKLKSDKIIKEKKYIEEIEETEKKLQKEYDELLKNRESMEVEINQLKNLLPQLGPDVLNLSVNQKLHGLHSQNTQLFNDYLPIKVWKWEEKKDLNQCSKRFLNDFSAICLTSLSVKNSFLLNEEIFDMLVIDEASQCDIASALPLIYRSKKVVIIGDPLQLKHITKVQKHEEKYLIDELNLEKQKLNYIEKSLYDFSFDLANKSSLETVFLDEHYRCHPQIIDFSNTYFYQRRLGQSMTVKTSGNDFQFGNVGINWINVLGEMHENKNINIAEVNRCVDLTKLLAVQFPDATIGIITPFVHQHKKISELLPVELRVRTKPDTVHKYQGDEKDIIIFTTTVTDNSPTSKADFINRNDYLLNVAITRARSSLYIIGNFNYCNKLRNGNIRTPLSNLANYVESLGRVN